MPDETPPSPHEGTEGLPPEDKADPAEGRGIIPPYIEQKVSS